MLRRLAQLVITLALPVFLVLTNVRLLMSEAYLHYEYSKPSFPKPKRFTVEERMAFARTSVNYLLTDAGIETLHDLADDSGPIYNERELRHMEDVKALAGMLNFDWFFTQFHLIFFEGDTWLFLATDTLIRLFPPQFWFDGSLIVGLLTLAQAAVVGGVAWFLGHRIAPGL